MGAPSAVLGILGAAAAAAIPVSEAASLDATTTVTVGAAIAVTTAIVAAAWKMATAQANLSTTIKGMRTDVHELKDAIEENITRDEFVGWLRIARAKGVDLPKLD